MFYLEKLTSKSNNVTSTINYNFEYVLIGESILNENIMPFYNSLKFVYRLVMKNNKSILEGRYNDIQLNIIHNHLFSMWI